jgi:hypothetical protein
MTEFTSQWLIPTITNLIASVIVWGTAKLLLRSNISIDKVKGVASSATMKILPIVLEAAVFIALFWYFFTQLRSLIEQPGPPSREDTALIAFWTFWALAVFLRLLAGKPLAR